MLALDKNQIVAALDANITNGKSVLLWVDALYGEEGDYIKIDPSSLRDSIVGRVRHEAQYDPKARASKVLSADFEAHLRPDGVLLIQC